jgi:MFS family permease
LSVVVREDRLGALGRRFPRLLRENENFRRYFVGQSVSLLGDQVSLIALPLTAVLALHASAGQMGALTTAYLLPNLLLSLHAGVWVDRRGRRRRTMLTADVVRGLLTASIPIAFAIGGLTWAQLYATSFLIGAAGVFFNVGYGGFFQTIIERDDYVAANTLLNGSRGFSFFAGTSLGGILVQLLRGRMHSPSTLPRSFGQRSSLGESASPSRRLSSRRPAA